MPTRVSRGVRGHTPLGNFEILYFENAIFIILRGSQSGLIALNSSQFFASKRTTMLIIEILAEILKISQFTAE